jgi:transcriptional regulator with XRE-family HTH domain
MQVSTVHFSGRRMRKARLRKDWSQADLARATGLPEGSLGRWERDEHEPQGAAVVLIARATGRDVEFFYVEGSADEDEEEAALRRRARDILSPLTDDLAEALLAECRLRIENAEASA